MHDSPSDVVHNPAARRAFALHDRLWKAGGGVGQANRYVYPVVSRRSRGVSIGINLNPDKACNYDCIYCCVDRTQPTPHTTVELPVLRQELAQMLAAATSGGLFEFDPFDKIPAGLRRINDVAFSGDGEPTSCPQFLGACQLAVELIAEVEAHGAGNSAGASSSPRDPIKIVVITNATLFHRPAVREALAFLDQHHGEIWAKLDAGTPHYFDLVDRTHISFFRVLDNLLWCCQTRPTVIQSLFMNIHGAGPTPEEIDAYAGRLAHILANGGAIKLVQIYTVARRVAETFATPLAEAGLAAIAAQISVKLPSLKVEIYP